MSVMFLPCHRPLRLFALLKLQVVCPNSNEPAFCSFAPILACPSKGFSCDLSASPLIGV
jgi:hypothetical protein